MKVLFVCTANICRSAYAEVLARHLTGPATHLEFDSAGVHGHDVEQMDPPMAAEATLRGVDPSGFRSKRLTKLLIDEADLILTAEAVHRRLILEERPRAMSKAFSLGQFARGLAASEHDPADHGGLLAKVRSHAPTAHDEDDIDDPYAGGHGQAQLAALEIDALLKLILPALSG